MDCEKLKCFYGCGNCFSASEIKNHHQNECSFKFNERDASSVCNSDSKEFEELNFKRCPKCCRFVEKSRLQSHLKEHEAPSKSCQYCAKEIPFTMYKRHMEICEEKSVNLKKSDKNEFTIAMELKVQRLEKENDLIKGNLKNIEQVLAEINQLLSIKNEDIFTLKNKMTSVESINATLTSEISELKKQKQVIENELNVVKEENAKNVERINVSSVLEKEFFNLKKSFEEKVQEIDELKKQKQVIENELNVLKEEVQREIAKNVERINASSALEKEFFNLKKSFEKKVQNNSVENWEVEKVMEITESSEFKFLRCQSCDKEFSVFEVEEHIKLCESTLYRNLDTELIEERCLKCNLIFPSSVYLHHRRTCIGKGFTEVSNSVVEKFSPTRLCKYCYTPIFDGRYKEHLKKCVECKRECPNCHVYIAMTDYKIHAQTCDKDQRDQNRPREQEIQLFDKFSLTMPCEYCDTAILHGRYREHLQKCKNRKKECPKCSERVTMCAYKIHVRFCTGNNQGSSLRQDQKEFKAKVENKFSDECMWCSNYSAKPYVKGVCHIDVISCNLCNEKFKCYNFERHLKTCIKDEISKVGARD